jgi:transposase-like protein
MALKNETPKRGLSTLEEARKQAILDAVELVDGNVAQAARKLGIAVSTLYRKLRGYGVKPKELKWKSDVGELIEPSFRSGRLTRRGVSTSRFAEALDKLARQVYHIDSSRWNDYSTFKEDLPFIVQNLADLSTSLSGGPAGDPRIRRAARRVTIGAQRLLKEASAVPNEIEDWRPVADHLAANYNILRFEAGRLYKVALPRSPFGVLKSAL